MSTIDQINRKMGKASIQLSSEGFASQWKLKQRKSREIQQVGVS